MRVSFLSLRAPSTEGGRRLSVVKHAPVRRGAGLLAAVVLALFGGITPVLADHLPVDSDPDTTGPVLTSFSISPTSVDVRVSSATITADARITDDKSGV